MHRSNKKFAEGVRVFYVGHSAKTPCYGTIVAYREANRYVSECVDIMWDEVYPEGDPVYSMSISTDEFKYYPNRNYWFANEWDQLSDYEREELLKVASQN